MKVVAITLHRITNFGSMLQTYATQTAIKRLGHEVEILDFVPEGMTFKRACFPKNDTPLWLKIIKFIPLFICNTIQFKIMGHFMNKYIHVTSKRYGSYQDILNNVPLADIYLSGSDQVWNTQNNNPKDDLKAYYLGFAPKEKKRIAYAGSFGKNNFSAEESQIVKEYLSLYDAISVREDDGLTILKQHGIDNGSFVVDPTLLLTSEDWQQFATAKKAPTPGYIFVYNLNRNKTLKQLATQIAKEQNLRIVNFADSFDFIPHAENRLFNSALDFINYIAHADLVLTDSFHGTAFSINFKRQFICVKAPRYNSRIESILRLSGLIDSRLATSCEEGLKISQHTINYENVSPCIEQARRNSLDFLKNALTNE